MIPSRLNDVHLKPPQRFAVHARLRRPLGRDLVALDTKGVWELSLEACKLRSCLAHDAVEERLQRADNLTRGHAGFVWAVLTTPAVGFVEGEPLGHDRMFHAGKLLHRGPQPCKALM